MCLLANQHHLKHLKVIKILVFLLICIASFYLFILNTVNISNTIIIENIFEVWESDSENHLLMFLLKISRDFVVQISSGISFHREDPL